MAENSKIQWTHHTMNFWRGCRKVHTGCENCYAENNFSCHLHGVTWGTEKQGGVRKVPVSGTLLAPFGWNRSAAGLAQRPRVFCMSLGDLFETWNGKIVNHKDFALWRNTNWDGAPDLTFKNAYVSEDQIESKFGTKLKACKQGFAPATLDDVRRDAFQVIQACTALDWLLLTKHGLWDGFEQVVRCWPHTCKKCSLSQWRREDARCVNPNCNGQIAPTELPHVWLLGSVSDQPSADRIVKQLHEIKRLGICRFVGLSAEPLIGPIVLKDSWNWLDWVIVGGESAQGGACRPADLDWMKSLVADCRRLRISCYVKQLGSQPEVRDRSGVMVPYETSDKKGGDPAEWPTQLRVRRYPTKEREL